MHGFASVGSSNEAAVLSWLFRMRRKSWVEHCPGIPFSGCAELVWQCLYLSPANASGARTSSFTKEWLDWFSLMAETRSINPNELTSKSSGEYQCCYPSKVSPFAIYWSRFLKHQHFRGGPICRKLTFGMPVGSHLIPKCYHICYHNSVI